jgi:hypothetical protein
MHICKRLNKGTLEKFHTLENAHDDVSMPFTKGVDGGSSQGQLFFIMMGLLEM